MIRADSLVPVRDALTNFVFQGYAVHIPVEKPRVEVQLVDQAEVELVNSSEAEVEQGEGEMVVRRTMTVDWFLPGSHPMA